MTQEIEIEIPKNMDVEEYHDTEGKNRVCRDLFPKGSYKFQKFDGFFMHPLLKQQLDFYINNAMDDWDFVILICAEGEVRTGKSVLAMQIAIYWTHEMNRRYNLNLPFNSKDNIVFDGKKLIEKGNALGRNYKHSAFIFDEAGADLEGTKAMLSSTRAVKDFLRECGQYNFLTILVLPEYFDLPKGVAVNRSRCLINVYWLPDEKKGKFVRGYYKFYSIPNKRKLYLRGKKELNYKAAPYDFFGEFRKFYPIDEEEYRKMKVEALKKRESGNYDKKLHQRNIAWWILIEKFGMTQVDLAKMTTKMGAYTIQQTIQNAIQGVRLSSDKKPEQEPLEGFDN